MSSEFALMKQYRFLWYQLKAFKSAPPAGAARLLQSMAAYEINPDFLLVPFSGSLFEPTVDPARYRSCEHIFFAVDTQHRALRWSSFHAGTNRLLDLFVHMQAEEEARLAYVTFVERKLTCEPTPRLFIDLAVLAPSNEGFAAMIHAARKRLPT